MSEQLQFKHWAIIVPALLAIIYGASANAGTDAFACEVKSLADKAKEVEDCVLPFLTHNCRKTIELRQENKLLYFNEHGSRNDYLKNYNLCEADLQAKCSPNLKSTIAKEELVKLYKKFRENPIFNMRNPSGLCRQRAYVLNKHLADLGYMTSTVTFISPAIVGAQRNGAGEIISAISYDYHVVSAIDVKESDGTITRMILDPQFAGIPMPEQDYYRMTTGSECREAPLDSYANECRFEIENGNSIPTDNPSPEEVRPLLDSCGWSMALKTEAELRTSENAKTPPPPLPEVIAKAQDKLAAAIEWASQQHLESLEGDRRIYERRLKNIKPETRNGQTVYVESDEIGTREISASELKIIRDRLKKVEAALTAFAAKRGLDLD